MPRLAEIRQPLVDALADAAKGAPSRSKRALESVPLTGIWGPEHDAAFERCKDALRHAVALYVPSDEDTIIVMSDASRVGWAGFVAACASSELDKPVNA